MNDSRPPHARFTQGPALHRHGEGARVVDTTGPVPPPLPAPPSLANALLTVRPHHARALSVVTPTKALLAAIPALRAGAPIDLVAPLRRGGQWFLDTRPTARARLPQAATAKMRFTIPAVAPEHLVRPAVAAPTPGTPLKGPRAGGGGHAGYASALTFRLGAEVTEEICLVDRFGQHLSATRGTGYYQLVPVRYGSAHQ